MSQHPPQPSEDGGERALSQPQEVSEACQGNKQVGPTPLRCLIPLGISARDTNRLYTARIRTVEAVAFATKQRLMRVKGISEAKADKLRAEAAKLVPMEWHTAFDITQLPPTKLKITTGSKDLDELLGGGVETGSITEFFGESGSGKTQLCYTLCVTAQLDLEDSGGAGKAMYIDSEGTFRPSRVRAVAARYGIHPDDVNENLSYARAHNTDHQLKLLDEVCELMSEYRYSVLIIDSATALYRTDYQGLKELAPRQLHLGQMLRCLQRIADTYGCAVVITNQVTAQINNRPSYIRQRPKPIGGNILAHASRTRLSLRKGRREIRYCKVFNSPVLPEDECKFAISPGGIKDPED